MIKKIIYTGFQAHERYVLELDPLVTTIIGPSDAGKSALIRGLRWACLNKPKGDSFVHHGAPFARVRVDLDSGSICRKRTSGGDNTYSTKQAGEEPVVYTAFRDKVPDGVQGLLKVGPHNFQGQHDVTFWLGATGSQVARELNSVIDLDIIDRSIKHTAQGSRKAAGWVELVRQRVADAKEYLEEMAWVEQAADSWAAVQSADVAQAEAVQAHSGLAVLLRQATQAQTEHKTQSGLAAALGGVLNAGEAAIGIRGRVVKLRADLTQANLAQAAVVVAPDFTGVAQAMEDATQARHEANVLQHLMDDIKEAEDIACQRKAEEKTAEAELAAAVKNRCPLCGTSRQS